MSNYTKTTDFEAKDSLPTGDSGKIIRGAEFETEFDAISTAIATKADTAGPTFTGTLTFETISDGTIGVTAFVDEDDMSSDSATLVPTQQSVKAYVDSQVTAQDLDFQADSGGALSIDLDSETMTFTGGTGIDTSGSGNAVTFAIDSTVATLTGTQTLTNKTLTAPTISGNLTTDGTIDGRDVATDGAKLDGIEAGATADQTAAEIRTLVDSASDSNVFTDADHTKLDGIEANATADQTAAEIRTLVDSASDSNVFTDSDHSKLDGIEAGATGDQTNAEIRAAVEAATDSNVFTDADHSKLDGIEAGADVTDTTNVTAAGAVMDSELTNETAVKSLDQGVATTDSPTFAGLTTSANVTFGDNDKAIFGAGSDLQIFHDPSGPSSVISDQGAGDLILRGSNQIRFQDATGAEHYAIFNENGAVQLYYDNSEKLATTSTGIDVTGTVVADGIESSGDFAFTAADGMQISAKETVGINIDSDDNDSSRAFTVTSGSSGSLETLIIASEDAGVTLYYDNAAKIATTSTGIDVTGTVTADGLTVDGNTTNLNYGKTFFTNGIGTNKWQIWNDNSGTDKFQLVDGDGHLVLQAEQNGHISFYEDTGTTAKLFWDASAERLGLGTTSPSYNLHISGGSASRVDAHFTYDAIGNGSSDGMQVGIQETQGGYNWVFENLDWYVGTNSTRRMTIKADGNVGIGTSSPAYKAQISDSGNTVLSVTSGDSSSASLYLGDSVATRGRLTYDNSSDSLAVYTDNNERMRIDSDGNLGISTSSPATGTHSSYRNLVIGETTSATSGLSFKASTTGQSAIFFSDGASPFNRGQVLYDHSSDHLAFASAGTERMRIDSSGNVLVKAGNELRVNRADDATYGAISHGAAGTGIVYNDSNSDGHHWQFAGTEKARIDSSGNLLVGTTDAALYNNTSGSGTMVNSFGRLDITRNDVMAIFNRNTSDGEIINFRKDGTTVGSIGANGGRPYFASGGCGVKLGGSDFTPVTSAGATSDNVVNLGSATARFKDLYLSGGVYLGGTGSANHLDDYEEGTWTPVVTDGTNDATMYTSAGNGGKYTKIGNLVTFTAQVTVDSIGSVGANARIKGLPFTNGIAGSNRAGVSVGYGANLNITAGRALSAYVELNQTNIYIFDWAATTGSTALNGSEISDDGSLFISGHYYAA